MPSCCIVQCGARKNKNQPELTIHRFPVNKILKKKWLAVIGVENINPRHKMWYVCSLHFDESSFNKTLDVTRLRDSAVPSSSLVPKPICCLPTSSMMISDETSRPVSCEIQNKSEPAGPMELELPEDNSTENVPSVKISNETSRLVLCKIQNKSEPARLMELELTEDNSTENVPSVKIEKPNAEIMILTKKCDLLKQKVRSLNEKIRRRDGKIAHLSNIIQDLQKRIFVNNEETLLLEECAGADGFLKRQTAKSKGIP